MCLLNKLNRESYVLINIKKIVNTYQILSCEVEKQK